MHKDELVRRSKRVPSSFFTLSLNNALLCIPQVGDARVDDRCSEGSIEASAERRVTLASDRKYPATDALAGTAGALLAAADALEAVDEGDFAERLRSGLETKNYSE